MADAPENVQNRGGEEEVWVAIEAFERILEAMPTDRASLEALAEAYAQIGDHTRAADYLLRLARVVVRDNDLSTAQSLIPQLEPHSGADPKVSDTLNELKGLVSTETSDDSSEDEEADASKSAPPIGDVDAAFNLADELSFAWSLMESEQLTQDEYSSVVQDLTEMSSSDVSATVSVLHALEFSNFKNLERIMLHVSQECGAPIVTLTSFNIAKTAREALPNDFMIRRGAMVFDMIGNSALVAVMNPHDKAIQRKIEEMLGKKCHFFMALPSDFDTVLNKMEEANDSEGVELQ